MSVKLMNKNQLFWWLNVSGWLIFTLFIYIVYKQEIHSNFLNLYLFSITYVIGFSITLILRFVYRIFYVKIKSILLLILLIIALSIVSQIIWYFADLMLSVPFWEEQNMKKWEEMLSVLSMVRYNILFLSVLFLWSSLYFSIRLWLDLKVQRELAAKASALAHQAQLQMLRYQLNPHFLFNSLNSIRALIDEDQKTAKLMITELSEFLRYSLINDNQSFKPLREELAALKLYFAIEKKRFEEKLDVTFDIQPECENLKVLSFLIQPFVENAIKYGMQTSTMPLRIRISAFCRNNKLILSVSNSGRWIEKNEAVSHGTGKGLENVTQRLESAFQGKYSFAIAKNPDNVEITLEIEAAL